MGQRGLSFPMDLNRAGDSVIPKRPGNEVCGKDLENRTAREKEVKLEPSGVF